MQKKSDAEAREDDLDKIKMIFEEKGREKVLLQAADARLRDLMNRKSSKKWSARKKAKMAAKLMSTKSELELASGIFDIATNVLERNGIASSS